jgi:hypothetical protein
MIVHHEHACELSKIIKVIISFTYTHDAIDALEERIVVWVQTYEKYVCSFCSNHNSPWNRYYYQYEESRLCTCPLTVDSMLHVCPDIRF